LSCRRGRFARFTRLEIEFQCLVSRVEIAQVRSSGEIVIRKIDSAIIKIRHCPLIRDNEKSSHNTSAALV